MLADGDMPPSVQIVDPASRFSLFREFQRTRGKELRRSPAKSRPRC